MFVETVDSKAPFKVIEGSAGKAASISPRITQPSLHRAPPEVDALGLARDIAHLYALALLRDVPFSQMNTPDCAIPIDGTDPTTLHDLLCELGTLPRPHLESGRLGTPSQTQLPSSCVQGPTDHRRFSLGGGQWKISDLLGATPKQGGPLSVFLGAGLLGATTPAAQIAPALPSAGAAMSDWLTWAQDATGACLALPTHGTRLAPVRTLTDLAAQTHRFLVDNEQVRLKTFGRGRDNRFSDGQCMLGIDFNGQGLILIVCFFDHSRNPDKIDVLRKIEAAGNG